MAALRGLLLLSIIFTIGKAEVHIIEKCPAGWTNFGVRCYKFFPQAVNYVTAERNCIGLDANLASSRNKVENDFLLSLLPSSSTRCWLGGQDAVQEGQWLWIGGDAFDFTYWGSGEPNNLNVENCLELNWTANRWNDVTCAATMGYMCGTDL